MDADPSLLELDSTDVTNSELYKSLLNSVSQTGLQSNDQTKTENADPNSKLVLPTPGCCIKCKTLKGGKVFINVCQADEIPAPSDVGEEELVQILSSEDQPDFRMPMSIGEPHDEMDNAGQACTVIDVAISPQFFKTLTTDDSRPVLHSFFCTAMIEGIQEKYGLSLEKEVKILKHRKSMGVIQKQFIRTKRFVREIGGNSFLPMESVQSSPDVPKHTFVKEPPVGKVQFIVGEISLPKVSSARQILLDVGGDCIVLDCRPFYYLDIYLPFDLLPDDAGSQFNVDTKILSLTIPVVQ